jgi:hypothetical protein
LYNFGFGGEHEPQHCHAHAWDFINICVSAGCIDKC